jgi:hypothetical protein
MVSLCIAEIHENFHSIVNFLSTFFMDSAWIVVISDVLQSCTRASASVLLNFVKVCF